MSAVKRGKAKWQARDRAGRYDFTNMGLVCICGHTLGKHAAVNDTRLRPCFANDMKDRCGNFKLRRERGPVAKEK